MMEAIHKAIKDAASMLKKSVIVLCDNDIRDLKSIKSIDDLTRSDIRATLRDIELCYSAVYVGSLGYKYLKHRHVNEDGFPDTPSHIPRVYRREYLNY